jgi:hypothetical protein
MHDNKQRLQDLREDIIFSGVVTFSALVNVSDVSDAAKEQLPKDNHYFGVIVIDDYLDNAPSTEHATLATDWHKLESVVERMRSRLEDAKRIATKYDMSLFAGSVSLFKNKYGTTISMTVGISDNTYVPPKVRPKRHRKPKTTMLVKQASSESDKETTEC